jgi:hypothetical protein
MVRAEAAQAFDGCQVRDHLAKMAEDPQSSPSGGGSRKLTPAAERALREAAERRATIERVAAERPKEVGGRSGLDPTRYGDWENKGLASDF